MEILNTEKFIENVDAYWTALVAEKSSRKANAINRTLEKLVIGWDQEEMASHLLESLIGHELLTVRSAAAAFLLRYYRDEKVFESAVLTLKDIAKKDPTLVGGSAAAVLQQNKIEPY